MKTRSLIIIIGLSIAGIFGVLYAPNVIKNMENQKTCEAMGGMWNADHCLITPETFDSNKLTCAPGPVMKSGTCSNDGMTLVIKSENTPSEVPDQLEEIDGYAIDYGGEVKHLSFADICTNPMKKFLLSHSNISSTDEEFVIEDIELPFGMNSEDFERCALETSFTKERSNMVEPHPTKCKSGPSPGDDHYFNDTKCEWHHVVDEVPIRCGEPGFNYKTGKCNPIVD